MKIKSADKINAISKSRSIRNLDLKYYPDVDISDYYFISYSHKDYRAVYKDLIAMEDEGLKFWYDRDIPVSKNWKEIANKFMRPLICKGIIFYLSENALKSEQTMLEIEYAKQVGKPIIAINLLTEFKDGKNKGKKAVISGEELVDYLIKNGKHDLEKYRKEISTIFSKDTIYLSINDKPSFKKNKILRSKNQPKLLINDDVISRVTDSTIINVTEGDFHGILVEKKYNFNSDYLSFSIGQCAFSNCQSLETVTFESPLADIVIEGIGDFAFSNCTSLKEVDFGQTMYLKLGGGTFYNCKSLTKLPAPVKVVGGGTFYGCESLTELEVLDSSSFSSYCFYGCSSLVEIKKSNIYETNVKVPFTEVGYMAFADCASLKEVFFPHNVVSIGERAFMNCTSLEKLVLPYQITNVENEAFMNCDSLFVVGIAAEHININFPQAFKGCINLSSIVFTEMCKDYYEVNDAIYKNNVLVYYPEGALNETLVIDENCKRVEPNAIFNNIYLKEIVLPKGFKDLNFVVSNCPNLERITVPGDSDYLKSINGVLYNKKLTRLIFVPAKAVTNTFKMLKSVISFSTHAFYEIKGINKVIFSDKIKTIDLVETVDWRRIILPKSLETLSNITSTGKNASLIIKDNKKFFNYNGSNFLYSKENDGIVLKHVCGEYKKLVIPEGVTKIEKYALDTLIHELYLPTSLKEFIANYALSGLSSIFVKILSIHKTTAFSFADIILQLKGLKRLIFHGTVDEMSAIIDSESELLKEVKLDHNLVVECEDQTVVLKVK